MIKVNAYARTGLFVMVCFGLLAMTSPTYAAVAPELSIRPLATSATSTTYAIHLINNGDIFNVIEFDLRFASNTRMTIGSIESALCRPEFTIDNTLSTTTGSWYVACGTFTPFSGLDTTIAIFTASNTMSASDFSFGVDTALYRHDGRGTKITPLFTSATVALGA